MGRKKIQISRILDQRNRQVTFTKRKFGLMKKAYELSVLCDCEIALIIFNSTNRLFQYASTDMDKVLLKYTEYSEPHESRTNTDILETLRRKGLGLDSSELDTEESVQVTADKYPLSESLDLSVARQRLYAPALLSPETQLIAGCENSFPNSSASNLTSNRTLGFKAVSCRPGSSSPAASHVHTTLMSPHAGIGYSVFSHGNVNRALDMKSPPPLNLGSENLRADVANAGLGSTRANHNSAQRGFLYQGLQGSNPMVAMGKAGLLSHGLGGYGLPPGTADYNQPCFYQSVSFQRGAVNPWQPAVLPQQPYGAHVSSGMSSGGCSFPSQTCSSDSAHLPSLNLSIKSERSSPEHMPSPSTPPLHHLRQRSPMSEPDPARRTPPETHLTNGAKAFPKAGYLHEEEVGGHPLRSLETDDGWQR
ncbi:myocyte-specific enhancer factor 2B isoform X1 [Oryzias melastigma]|uniref:myocyte-specific enhancer factor 2B isoform X1 n=1 Tax=Oryzias melastigma TaxID=30732 RepID=UPI000CF81A23|nr:myocyte-specific enhancer factor 2B isoform X1 [Oryzias melastigma]